MRYIGGKSILLDKIYSEIIGLEDVHSIMDIFAGSGAVSTFLKQKGYDVISNDFLYFSYVLARGTVGISSEPTFKKLGIGDVVTYLNELRIEETDISLEDCFVYNNYSPNERCSRMYFQNKNAIKIDVIRQVIEQWKTNGLVNEDEYYYLLAMLINAIPYVANITGTFGAYLKFWDKRTYNDLKLQKPDFLFTSSAVRCFNKDYIDMLSEPVDLLYADPPYNSREYLPNYHVLETIARYDNPQIKGVTGIRSYTEQKSEFCKKRTVYSAFEKLIQGANSQYILISYNNEGLLGTDELAEICQDYAAPNTFRLIEMDYRRYKNKIPNNTEGLKEQLYFLRKK